MEESSDESDDATSNASSVESIDELTLKLLNSAAMAFCVADNKSNDYAKWAYIGAVRKWEDEMERCAEDLSYAASTDARTMSAEEVWYFTQVIPDIYWSYLCRKQNCMFFGGNNVETWIKNKASRHLRCPLCGCQNPTFPRETETDDVPAQMVLTFTNPLMGELMHIPTAYPWPETPNGSTT